MLTGYLFYHLITPEPVASNHVVDSTQLDNVELLDPAGTGHLLSQWRGKPQIINYWATWCGPCREEIPVLVKAQEHYEQQGLVVIGLSMDYPDDSAVVQQFISEYSINYPVLMAADVGNQLADFYGADNFVLPISIFITAEGEVKSVHAGLLEEKHLTSYLSEIL